MSRIDTHARAKREQQQGRQRARAGAERGDPAQTAEGRALQELGNRRHIQANIKNARRAPMSRRSDGAEGRRGRR